MPASDEQPHKATDLHWVDDPGDVDWQELSDLYRIAPLGNKPPETVATVFTNSMYNTFVYGDGKLIGVGRALADGADCAYIADVAVHPHRQGHGLGAAIVARLLEAAKGHRKIILYANPGTEAFYLKLGFLPMNTAMAVWQDPASAIEYGLLSEAP